MAFPSLLYATHRYSPLSALLTFVIVKVFLFDEKLILISSFGIKGDPFLVHDIVGAGSPLAPHDKVTLVPSGTDPICCGCVVICGAAVVRKKNIHSVPEEIITELSVYPV